jgi:hypothetical protein
MGRCFERNGLGSTGHAVHAFPRAAKFLTRLHPGYRVLLVSDRREYEPEEGVPLEYLPGTFALILGNPL